MLFSWCTLFNYKKIFSFFSFNLHAVNHDAPATIIDGTAIANEIRSEISKNVQDLKTSYGEVPGLAVILVGHRRDSESYVRNKIKACKEVGIRSLVAQLSDSCSSEEVVESVTRFNEDPSVHGILVQLPLPQVFI
jgi:5,10-methylene-tetrahydrofolate dehydrogenase/methenyl tetrahydrofolate cyclohydrolase